MSFSSLCSNYFDKDRLTASGEVEALHCRSIFRARQMLDSLCSTPTSLVLNLKTCRPLFTNFCKRQPLQSYNNSPDGGFS